MQGFFKRQLKSFCLAILGRESSFPHFVEEVAGENILLFAPHPDDAVFSCGGTILKSVRSGKHFTIVYMTGGAKGASRPNQPNQLVKKRKEEAKEGAAVIGVNRLVFLDFPDLGLQKARDALDRTREILSTSKPDSLFFPFFLDAHPDHRATADILGALLQEGSFKGSCYLYETWTPLPANILVDISSEIEDKIKAVRCHRSQISETDLDDFARALNRYRAMGTRARLRDYAEAFLYVGADEYVQLWKSSR